MKTRLFFSLAFALLAGSVSAQYRDEMSERLTRDEVPAAVQQSLVRKLGSSSNEGNWVVFYIETTIWSSHQAEFTPWYYDYSRKLNGKKIEYLFKPDGTPYQDKGKDAKVSAKQS
jgi:hypothetical protein